VDTSPDDLFTFSLSQSFLSHFIMELDDLTMPKSYKKDEQMLKVPQYFYSVLIGSNKFRGDDKRAREEEEEKV